MDSYGELISDDKIEAIEKIKGYRVFMWMGGFVQEYVHTIMKLGFDKDVIEFTDRICGTSGFYIDVIDQVQKMKNKKDLYKFYYMNNEAKIQSIVDDDLYKWLLEKTAIIELQHLENGVEPFWKSMELTDNANLMLINLSALYERILYLSLGIDGNPALTAKEISELEEFQCETFWIERILNDMDLNFEFYGTGKNDFKMACEKNRKKYQKGESF